MEVANLRVRLPVSKQAAQKFQVERFNLMKQNELNITKKYQIKFSNKYAVLENLNDSKNTKRALKNSKENFKTSDNEILGLYKLKQHKLLLNEECLGFLDQRKQA